MLASLSKAASVALSTASPRLRMRPDDSTIRFSVSEGFAVPFHVDKMPCPELGVRHQAQTVDAILIFVLEEILSLNKGAT